jgi:hypothetical protein
MQHRHLAGDAVLQFALPFWPARGQARSAGLPENAQSPESTVHLVAAFSRIGQRDPPGPPSHERALAGTEPEERRRGSEARLEGNDEMQDNGCARFKIENSQQI